MDHGHLSIVLNVSHPLFRRIFVILSHIHTNVVPNLAATLWKIAASIAHWLAAISRGSTAKLGVPDALPPAALIHIKL
jgi:hypothetical protein